MPETIRAHRRCITCPILSKHSERDCEANGSCPYWEIDQQQPASRFRLLMCMAESNLKMKALKEGKGVKP